MKPNNLFQCPANPSQRLRVQPIDSGEHISCIIKAKKKQHHLQMKLELLPEGHDHPHLITYSIPENWTPGSEFTNMLTNFGVLMSPGSYFDPRSLVGLPIMVDIQADKDEMDRNVYTVLGMRPATEQEATRTDFDEDDLSADFDDVSSDFAHNEDSKEEIDWDGDEDRFDLEDELIWED